MSEYVDVESHATDLGCNVPTAWAILPRNFSEASSRDELINESSASTVRTLLRQSELSETPLEQDGERFPQVQENAFTWIGPILFFAAAELSRNPEMVSVACGVIGNYLTDFFRGKPGEQRVQLDIVVEQTRTKRTVKLHYDRTPEGLAEIPQTISDVCGDTRANAASND